MCIHIYIYIQKYSIKNDKVTVSMRISKLTSFNVFCKMGYLGKNQIRSLLYNLQPIRFKNKIERKRKT